MGKKIGIIEDDAAIRRVLNLVLRSAGYEVVAAGDGYEGLAMVAEARPDLVLLDLMLPGLDGLSVCRCLRSDPTTRSLPIIMLTAKVAAEDVVRGLDAGANDYVMKPFQKDVLLARIRAALRGTEEADVSRPLVMHGLSIDAASHVVTLDGQALELTLSEFRILELLVRNSGRVFSRGHIIDRISDGEKIVTDRTIDVQMVGLRRKLGAWAEHIKTIRGVGYRAE